MDVVELLAFQPDKPHLKRKREENGKGNEAFPQKSRPSDRRLKASNYDAQPETGISEEEKERIMKLLDEEPEAEVLDETSLRRLLLSFEKKVLRNQEMRIKYPDQPE
ncbi:uncharacterized protein LOC102805541, partial [Saccoglossus kowalevskii]|uniref:Beta-catenin-like protein 1-like n=1 Tax=Saccoglossus kowalevskii TaxID=10224 RepID=A0ABM0M8V4_SACKO